ncbi:MAG TPA: response regulator [Bacteroidia bacterium]|nr:response regulator [Bacteroidia bacterium]
MRSEQINIFIIDDDKILSHALKNEINNHFEDQKVNVRTFEAGELCEPFLKIKPDIAIVDYHLNSKFKDAKNGVEIIEMIKKQSPDTEVILFTKDDNLGLAVEAFQNGANEYVVKNDYMFRRLNVAILQCLKYRELKLELKWKKERRVIAMVLIGVLLSVAIACQILAKKL